MAKFAGYGFNKCHAAPYGLLAYQTAWLKANHPEVFIAACMSLAINNTDRLAALKQEAESGGIAILPPDINRSAADFSVERLDDGRLAIRYALAGGEEGWLRGHAGGGRGAWRHAVRRSRRFRRPRSIHANSAAPQLENLVRAGAFDRLEANRARLFAGAETIMRRAQAKRRKKQAGRSACSAASRASRSRCACRIRRTGGLLERLSFEAEAIGFHLTAHPLDAYAQALRRLGAVRANEVEARARAGVTPGRSWPARSSRPRNGSPAPAAAWPGCAISDASGSVEVTCFSEVLSRSRETLAHGSNVLVTGGSEGRGRGDPGDGAGRDVAGSGRRLGRCVDPHLAAARPKRCRTSAICSRVRVPAEDG